MIHKARRKKINPHSSLFIMILCINLCSIVVLSAFNYYVFHRMSSEAYLSSFLTYNQRVTDLAIKNIDSQIMQPVLKIAQLYFSPIRENRALLLAQEKQIQGSSNDILALSAEMGKIKKSCPYIAGIDLYYEGTNTIVTGFDKIHFPADEGFVKQFLPWYEEYKNGEMAEGFQFNKDGAYLMNDPVITYIKRISNLNWHGKSIILAVYVDPVSFDDYIDQAAGTLSILTNDGRALYDSGAKNGSIGGAEDILAFAQKEGIDLQEDPAPFAVKLESGSMMVFHGLSPVSGLTYLYSMDAGLFYKDYDLTNRMLWVNYFISVLFNLIVLVVLSCYSYFAYRGKVLALTRNAGIPLDGSKRSFDGSLTVLGKEINTLHAVAHSSRGLLFQKAVRAMIFRSEAEESAKALLGYFNGDSVCALLILISESEQGQLDVEGLQEGFRPGREKYDALFTTVEKEGLVAILSLDGKGWEGAGADFARQMNSRWEGCRLVSGLLCAQQDGGVKKSYMSAVEAARYLYIFPGKQALSFEQIKMDGRKGSGSHLRLFEALKKDMNSENLLEVKYHLEVLIESFKTGSYTIDYCISTLRDLVTMLYQTMQQYQLDMWQVFGYDIREYFKKVRDIDEFYHWCDGVSEKILKNIHQKKQAVDIDIRTRIVALVDENLEKNVTLDFLAEQLHIRQDVASRTFRQATGKSYTEYIKTKKLNRAVELLAEDYSVKEIAEKLGYSTAQYFIKVFKQNYGITPYQYKKNRTERKE